jgi:uncharacterized protein (DUF488 family)
MGQVMLFTIGYEGRTQDELLHLLETAGVNTVVDLRLTPISRKPGLSKNRLADGLRRAHIDYVHLPALGNPRDNREGFRKGEPKSRARFSSQMSAPQARNAIEELCLRTASQRVALLCFERDAGCCHRGMVGDELVRHAPDLIIEHL